MKQKAGFWALPLLALCAGLILCIPAGAATTGTDGDPQLELIPPPPGPAPATQAPLGAGGLVLPEGIQPAQAPPTDRLSAPRYLTAIAGNRSVLLSWYQSEGPRPLSGYLVYRGTAPDAIVPEPIHAAPITETNYSDSDANSLSGPRNRQTYYYRVRAFDVDGRLSDYSDLVAATPSGPLLPPARLSASGGPGRVSLQWSEPVSTGDGELAGFRILRGEASGRLAPYRELGPEARSFEDSGLPDGKAFFYAVATVDDAGNVSPASPEARAAPFRPLGAPQGLSALGVGDQAVRLRWSPPAQAGTFKVKGYNIYRASAPPVDLGSLPINKGLIPASRTRFEDGPDDSVEAPKRGVDYTYVVVAVDEEDNPSAPSRPSVAGPVASLTKLETGEIEVAGGNTLQISGRKTIDASYTWVAQDENRLLGAGALGGFMLDQQLQVRLTGKVGRKIKVDVDYDDKAVGADQQKISVVYTGDQQEVFREFAFGDITMDLSSPRTEFAGYNKALFGAKLKLMSPDEKLRLTAVGAQTKGITESKRIVGGYEQARTGNALGEDRLDLSFQPYKFYYLSRDKDLVEGPDYIVPGSVDIWLDQPGFTIFQSGRVEVPDRFGTGRFYFIRLVPNVDYNVDNSSGLVTFHRAIGERDNIAVAYRVQKPDGTQVSVGYAPDGSFDFTPANLDSAVNTGRTTDSQKMIQYGSQYANQFDSHMSMQFYRLNGRDILNPQLDPDFKLQIYAGPSIFFELDPRSNFSDIVEFDLRQGWMRFRVPFPFRQGNTADRLRMDPAFNAVEEVFSPDLADAYSRSSNRVSNFRIHVEYKYRVSSYNLRFGIIRGSEVILLDGRRLARDIDYFLDYDTGALVFSNPDMIKDNSVVDATYEYLPFGGQFTSTIWGTRGEYDITKDISVGSTFLWNSADATAEVPDVRAAPYSLQILDGDIQARVPQDLLDGITRRLPLLPERDGVIGIGVRAEMARSWMQPNTYGRNNENGVAMIDSFEAVENVVSVSMERTAWVPSSRPLLFNGHAGMPAAGRRFTRFSTVQERAHDAAQRVANNENPNRNMMKIDWVAFDGSDNWDGFAYSFGQGAPQALQNASYLEVWVKVDSPVTLHIDVGQIDEDSTDNGVLDTESATGVLSGDQDIGLYNAFSAPGPYPRVSESPDSYPDPSYWGRGNRVVDSEDLNGNGVLDRANNYYAFRHELQPSPDFQLVQIPLSAAGIVGQNLSVVPGHINYFANVQALRLWIRGQGGVGGTLLVESIQFKGNKWQVRADPNVTSLGVSVTANTDHFQVNAINRLNNATVAPHFIYVPNTDFYNRQTNRSDDREQSLQLEYALTRLEQDNGRPYYQARKLLANGLDVDLGVYQRLRLDLYKPHETLPGERLLIRLGIDDQNYFEYQVPLDGLSVGAWNSVALALDGSDGRRTQLGRPYLRQVRYVSLAIHTLNDNLNPDPRLEGYRQLLWVNNLRLTNAIARQGAAQRLGLTYDLMGGALVVNHDFREVESDFVKMDQQAVDPARHERSQVVDARLNAVQGVPVTLRHEVRERFTDGKRRDDPKYSRNFVDPDEQSFRTSGTLAYNRIPGLSLGGSASNEHSRQVYLPAYVQALRELALPEDRIIVPHTTREDRRLSQDTTWRIPQSWWVVGNDELRTEVVLSENKVIFDQPSVSLQDLAYKDVERRTRTLRGRYSGSYKPASWATLSPGYAYTLVEAEGNIPVPTVLSPWAAYYDLGLDRRSEGWVPQSRVINPSLQVQFQDLGPLRNPRVAYNATQTRDYVRNDLRTPASLDLGVSLNLASLGKELAWMPALDVTQGFGADSVINNEVRIRSQQRQADLDAWMRAHPEFGERYRGVPGQNLPALALAEQQSFLQSPFWVRLEDLGLGEDLDDPLHIENLAQSSSRRSNTAFSTRFNVGLAPGWNGTFSPRLGFLDERTMSAPEQITRRYQTTTGLGIEFRDPGIPWKALLKPSALTVDYSFSNSDSYVVLRPIEQRNANSTRQGLGLTLPMRPSERVALTASLREDRTGESTYLPGQSQPVSSRETWQLTPAFKLVYFLDVNRLWKMPDVWPFHGRELRIRQSFRLDNDLSLAMRREKQQVTSQALPESGSDTYTMLNQLGYDVMDNVKMKFSVEQRFFNALNAQQAVNLGGNYYSIALKLGLEAIF